MNDHVRADEQKGKYMPAVHSLALSARITLDLHSLNNEGTEGNQQQPRTVYIIDQKGRRAVVNALSGDMFKHILVGHLIPLLESAGEPLSPGARMHDADRINAANDAFAAFCEDKNQKESDILTRILSECSLTDLAGTLVTRGRVVGRKSIAEFGWVVGLPTDAEGSPLTITEQYFHVKYAPEGRSKVGGGDTVAGGQAVFYRPASSGVYALICNLDFYRIGLNDITRQYVVAKHSRQQRAKALIGALAATLIKPVGAQRNTQSPHIVGCEGVIAVSSSSLPAPMLSPLHDGYRVQIAELAQTLGVMNEGAVAVHSFDDLAGAVRALAQLAQAVNLPD